MQDVTMFSEMTGDRNPLHYDAALAASSPFGELIVQGGVTSGLLNAVVAEDLPGPGTVFLGVEWRFLKAVAVGEEITARVEVVTVRDDKPICTVATTVRNARGGLPFWQRRHLHCAADGAKSRLAAASRAEPAFAVSPRLNVTPATRETPHEK